MFLRGKLQESIKCNIFKKEAVNGGLNIFLQIDPVIQAINGREAASSGGKYETLKESRSSGSAPPWLMKILHMTDSSVMCLPHRWRTFMGVDSDTLLQFALPDMRHKSNSGSKQTQVTENPV